MSLDIIKNHDFSPEFKFTASRSGGPGGQNVNKVSTKVELRFDVMKSALLTDEEKDMLLTRLASRINADSELILVAQSERSQLKNKEKVIEKFYIILAKALTPRKKRKPTKPPAEAKEKRLEEKRILSEKKERRKKKI